MSKSRLYVSLAVVSVIALATLSVALSLLAFLFKAALLLASAVIAYLSVVHAVDNFKTDSPPSALFILALGAFIAFLVNSFLGSYFDFIVESALVVSGGSLLAVLAYRACFR